MITHTCNHIESEDYYEHTFRNTVFGTVVVKSQYESDHLNPIMDMLELSYDNGLDSIWYGGSKNKDEFDKLKSYYPDDKTTFKKVYTEHAEAVIETLKKDIAEQERLIEYWTGDTDQYFKNNRQTNATVKVASLCQLKGWQ